VVAGVSKTPEPLQKPVFLAKTRLNESKCGQQTSKNESQQKRKGQDRGFAGPIIRDEGPGEKGMDLSLGCVTQIWRGKIRGSFFVG